MGKLGLAGLGFAAVAFLADSTQLHPSTSHDLITLWAGGAIGTGGTLWAVRQILDLMRSLRQSGISDRGEPRAGRAPLHDDVEQLRAGIEEDFRELLQRLASLEAQVETLPREFANLREQTQTALAELRRAVFRGRAH